MNRNEIEIPFDFTEGQDVYSGRKTATRRVERHGAEAGMKMRAVFRDYSIVDLHITSVYNQRLGDMSEDDAKREGCESLDAFKKAWIEHHRGWDPEQSVWVIEWKKPT